MGTTDLDHENTRPQDAVLGSFLGLVIVGQGTLTIRLIRYTLQEHLPRPGILPNAHSILAQSCLAYLNYDQVRGLPANSPLSLSDIPFLVYSSFYWASHPKMELPNQVKNALAQTIKPIQYPYIRYFTFQKNQWFSPILQLLIYLLYDSSREFTLVNVFGYITLGGEVVKWSLDKKNTFLTRCVVIDIPYIYICSAISPSLRFNLSHEIARVKANKKIQLFSPIFSPILTVFFSPPLCFIFRVMEYEARAHEFYLLIPVGRITNCVVRTNMIREEISLSVPGFRGEKKERGRQERRGRDSLRKQTKEII